MIFVYTTEQYKTIGRVTRPLNISRFPVFERRRYDEPIAKTLTFDDTSNLNIRSICRSLRKRVESSKQNNHSNNQIENDLNEKSEETMSASEENVKKAQINVKENLELKLTTQASAERMHLSRRRGRPLKRPVDVDKLVGAFSKLTRSQIGALDTTTWSKKSRTSAPNVWSIMCSHLKLKDDEKNKKWLTHIWQTNMWHVTDEVRKKTSENTNVIDSVKFDVSPIITHDVAVGSPSVVPKETGCSSALSNIINVIENCSQSEIYTIDSSNRAANLNSSKARANEILDDILTLVNLKEVSPVCNKDSTSPKIQSSTIMNMSPQFIMNSPTKEVCSNEITLTTYRVTTVKDYMNWHQLDEIQDFHMSNEDKLFPDFDDLVMDEYQKTTTDNQHNIIHFDEKSISPTANKEQQQTHENNKVSKQCVHNETERGVTSLPDEYHHVIDALLDRPTIAGQYTADVPSEPISLQIDKSDLDFFQKLVMESKSKKMLPL
ncbi:unnamed protein product [Rotaria socialis]|uniref:Uncharacterized protein n=1 Tax=Rotaria socialis TaxID=392032 RepID=A0A820XGD6_9BILA|nr:unnamed protein product [Rotaria socialis]